MIKINAEKIKEILNNQNLSKCLSAFGGKYNNIFLKSALALAVVDLVLIAVILTQVNGLVKDVVELQNRQAEVEGMRERLKKAEEIKMPEVKEEEIKIPEELKNVQVIYKKWGQETIYKSNIDGTDEQELIQDKEHFPISLAISPDKQKIAYIPSYENQIKVINLSNQETKTLINLQKTNWQASSLMWGTDNKTIVYQLLEYEKTEPQEMPKVLKSQTRIVNLDGTDKLISERGLNYTAYLSEKNELWVKIKPGMDEVTNFGEILIINTQTQKEKKIVFGNQNWSIYDSSWQYSSDYSKIYFIVRNEKQELMIVECNILTNSYEIITSTAEEAGRLLLSLNRQYQIYTRQISKQTERREQELEIWIVDLISKENKKIGDETGLNTKPLFWINNNWMLFLHRKGKKSSDIFGGKEGTDQYYLLSVNGEKIILANFEQNLNFIDWVNK